MIHRCRVLAICCLVTSWNAVRPLEALPADAPNAASPSSCGQQDSDSDGTPDDCDLCPTDADYGAPAVEFHSVVTDTDGIFDSGTSIALGLPDRLYVAEGNTTRKVKAFSLGGVFQFELIKLSEAEVDEAPSGSIFVLNRSFSSPSDVRIFTHNGALIGSFPVPTPNFNGIAVDAENRIHLLNNGVAVYDTSGALLHQFGSVGSGDGQFLGTTGIALDGIGRIYVVEISNHRVQVFGPQGQFLYKFGSLGSGNGQFGTPEDIDVGGYIVVADPGDNKRVQVFDAQGGFLLSFNGSGSAVGPFTNPKAVAIDSTTGRIYVLDGSQVEVFGGLPPDTDEDGVADCNDACPQDPDYDNDGFGSLGLCGPADCDDSNAACALGCEDSDNDGLTVCAGDCDDSDPNCALDCTDADGDGFCVGVDCYDQSAGCTTSCVDADADGAPTCAGDCDDLKAGCIADCTDADGDGLCADMDCDDGNGWCRTNCTDADGDGVCIELDCDDSDANCMEIFDCWDSDGDGLANCKDCDEENPHCSFSCVDEDGDDWCVGFDCFDQSPNCTASMPGCSDFDLDGVPNCADCAGNNPQCGLSCLDEDGDGFCLGVDCNDDSATCTASCADADMDGVALCAGDCDDGDSGTWELPGEVPALTLARDGSSPGAALLAWDAPAAGAVTVFFDLVRSGGADDFEEATCVVIHGATTSAVDSPTPAVGGIFYYLVRAENSCGDGPAGERSDGSPRTLPAC